MSGARASDIAYERLREMILTLELEPGAAVNEKALADELGLGRMPVREALGRLATDRFVSIVPRRGATITPFTLDEVMNMFEAREAIECGSAYIVASRVTPDDLAMLRSLVEAVDRSRMSRDFEQFLADDYAVHSYMARAVRNSILEEAADRLFLHTLRFYRHYWRNRPVTADAMLSHADLLEALESGDGDRAEKAMRRHLQASRQLVRLLF